MVFVEASSANECHETFEKKYGDKTTWGSTKFFSGSYGTTKEEAWQEALDNGYIRLNITFDEKFLKLPMVEVINKQQSSMAVGANCCKCKKLYKYAEPIGQFTCWACKNGF
jgi:hypothetical protein